MKTSSKILSGSFVVIIVAFIVLWYQNRENALSSEKQNNQTVQIPEPQPNVNGNSNSNTKVYSYKNGSYSVSSDYMSPAGQESMGVKISLENDKVTSVTINNLANNKVSSNYQNIFSSGIQSVALDKNLSSLKVGVVSGASLTSNAFNLALANIKAQAKAN